MIKVSLALTEANEFIKEIEARKQKLSYAILEAPLDGEWEDPKLFYEMCCGELKAAFAPFPHLLDAPVDAEEIKNRILELQRAKYEHFTREAKPILKKRIKADSKIEQIRDVFRNINKLCESDIDKAYRYRDDLRAQLSPQPESPWDAETTARNKWIYEQCMTKKIYKKIIFELEKMPSTKGWDPINSPSWIKSTAKRYAEVFGLPEPSTRRPGRPPSPASK